jgi:hypothetical protein
MLRATRVDAERNRWRLRQKTLPKSSATLSLEAPNDPAETVAGSSEMLVWYRRDAQKKPRSSGSRPCVPG